MRQDFATLAGCQCIWDVTDYQATDRVRERTTAVTRLSRERVRFSLENCDVIEWDETVACLGNSKGADLYLYPGFIIYRKGGDFSVDSFLDLDASCTAQCYQEDESLPKDSEIVGKTWAKGKQEWQP
jgi:hypothetical protein